MIVASWSGDGQRPAGLAALFGTGLIGGAILSRLRARLGARATRLPWDWTDGRPREARAVEDALAGAMPGRAGTPLAVIWAAGGSGFGTDAEGMARERAALDAVLALARRLGARWPEAARSFHLVSSAGGLFEGQVACGRDAVPRPLRPYGAGKLDQERAVAADAALGLRRIYRPSSVYGYAPGARRNLVSVLVAASLHRRPARIVGAMTTQRDYVPAWDVGRFVAERVRDPGPAEVETHLLASGRPASIFEIVHLVEGLAGEPLHLQIDPRPENARDNSFLPSALPPGLRRTGLAEGIERTAAAMRAQRLAGVMP